LAHIRFLSAFERRGKDCPEFSRGNSKDPARKKGGFFDTVHRPQHFIRKFQEETKLF